MDKLAQQMIRLVQAEADVPPALVMAAAHKLNRQADELAKRDRYVSRLQAKNATQAEHLRKLQSRGVHGQG